LRERYRSRLQTTIREVGDSFERQTIERWDFNELPVTHQLKKKGVATLGYPTLVDNGSSVDLRLFDDPDQAEFQLMQGITRLILLELKQSVKYLQKNLLNGKNSALRLACFGKTESLLDDLLCAAIKHSVLADKPLPRTSDSFNERVNQAKEKLTITAQELDKLVFSIGDAIIAIHADINQRQSKPLFKPIAYDIKNQLEHFVPEGFLFHTQLDWLRQYPRYLQSISVRIEKSDAQVQKDLNSLKALEPLLLRLANRWPRAGNWQLFSHKEVEDYRWMLEEYRVSLFAQPMKTRMPVSPKRLDKQWEAAKPFLTEL